jgi:hypothetical protein
MRKFITAGALPGQPKVHNSKKTIQNKCSIPMVLANFRVRVIVVHAIIVTVVCAIVITVINAISVLIIAVQFLGEWMLWDNLVPGCL